MHRQPVRAIVATLGLVAAAGVIAALAFALGIGDSEPADIDVERIAERAESGATLASGDPLAWAEERSDDMAARATLGTSHVIYEKSPGGVLATAERVANWRKQIESAAAAEDVDPDTLEALVFLESAGRSQVMADGTPESASGLTQIIPSTATSLLGMSVDLSRSKALTKEITKAIRKDKARLADRLVAERAKIDQRFDPQEALAGAARYLRVSTDRFGSGELAVVSYHMGIGNLENVIAAYTGDPIGDESTKPTVDENDIDYPKLYFDSSPQNREEAWKLLSGFGDDSSLYLWRIRASLAIMALWRQDPDALQAQADLATQKATLEETYHPEDETEIFENPGDVEDATDDGELVAVPDDPSLGFKVSKQAGELAPELDVEPQLYRVLRPEALAALTYLSAKVKAISGSDEPLTLTSATRDTEYQDLLVGVNSEATQEYSLHTTGWSFDIRRDYASDAQAEAFQYALDRLRANAILDYAYEPAAIHVTVSENAELLLED